LLAIFAFRIVPKMFPHILLLSALYRF